MTRIVWQSDHNLLYTLLVKYKILQTDRQFSSCFLACRSQFTATANLQGLLHQGECIPGPVACFQHSIAGTAAAHADTNPYVVQHACGGWCAGCSQAHAPAMSCLCMPHNPVLPTPLALLVLPPKHTNVRCITLKTALCREDTTAVRQCHTHPCVSWSRWPVRQHFR